MDFVTHFFNRIVVFTNTFNEENFYFQFSKIFNKLDSDLKFLSTLLSCCPCQEKGESFLCLQFTSLEWGKLSLNQ